jgi:2-keto-3-deoxy-L-rhamnonate aldolase RhmA
MRYSDIFSDHEGQPRIVRGLSIYSGSVRLTELAGRLGFDTVWIEMEHGPTDFTQAESICHAIEATGGFGTIRISDAQRTHVLRALETGARMILVPMINTAEQARRVVEFGKFPPLGQRGFYTRSRGLDYGLTPLPDRFDDANARTHLIVQIETQQALDNVSEICRVPGISGILMGPGDMSASLGITGDFKHPRLISAVQECIRTARAAGLHAGALAPSPGPMLEAALSAGCDFVFCGGDINDLIDPWRRILTELPTKPSRA